MLAAVAGPTPGRMPPLRYTIRSSVDDTALASTLCARNCLPCLEWFSHWPRKERDAPSDTPAPQDQTYYIAWAVTMVQAQRWTGSSSPIGPGRRETPPPTPLSRGIRLTTSHGWS
eukprot:1179481-Prorocentrum_minimum.AAC.2